MSFFKKKDKKKDKNHLKDLPEERASLSPLELENKNNPLGGIAWYQKNYYLAMKLSLFLAFNLVLSVGCIVIIYLSQPKPVYFAVTPDLQIAKLVPLSQPVMTDQGLLNWTTEVITSAISLDFLHWRDKLQSVRPNFAETAFISFTQSMSEAGILQLIQDKRLNLSSVVKQAPIITNTGVIEGAKSWKIEFPLLLSYESSQGVELTQELLAEVIVSRASTVTTPKGVLIKQVILRRK